MASRINADSSNGLQLVSDSSGEIQIQSNGVTVATINSSGLSMNSGTLAGNGPAFRAYLNSNQTISATTFTKIQFNTEEFDTTSDYDNATNYRFTPSVAGYYSVTVNGCFASVTRGIVDIYKNGVAFQRLFDNDTNGLRNASGNILIYLNGTTDYIEAYAWRQSSGDLIGNVVTNASRTSIQAHLARAD
mgnify:CR=1 FL=1